VLFPWQARRGGGEEVRSESKKRPPCEGKERGELKREARSRMAESGRDSPVRTLRECARGVYDR
jgi:hypothetical protein